ncbi:hypothetical protein BT69DRAFT_661776 [Atractiella rhizophila]|nr:hypothetical protein BT69DRAFT_661776 [Atractiella rhizophila]
MQSSILSPRMKKRKTSISHKDSQETDSTALVHLITAVMLEHGIPVHLSVLPSFLVRLLPSIDTLRITFDLPLRIWSTSLSKLFSFSLEGLENVVESDGTLDLCIALEEKTITVTFGDTKHHASMDSQDLSLKPFTCMFHLPDNRSEVIFKPVARYSNKEHRFVPINHWEESTIPSTALGTTIQLSLCPTQTPGNNPCTIAQLPTEILSLLIEFLSFDKNEKFVEGLNKEYLVSFQRLSAVCRLWKAVSVPYLDDLFVSMKDRYARLKQYPHAGRLWTSLQFERMFEDDVSVEMAKDIIAGSPNVTTVRMDAFWSEEEAKTVLHAIEGLTRPDYIWFGGQGSRKWKKDAVENFVWRMGDRIRTFRADNVEDSASSTSPGLQLSSDLKSLALYAYPPLPLLSLPQTLIWLCLSNLCPLPPSVSGSCLPPLLEYLEIKLAPYWPAGKISMLPTPLNLSHLKHLTELYLDGGEESSNLVSPQFFHTLISANLIKHIDVEYCVVDWEFTGHIFPDSSAGSLGTGASRRRGICWMKLNRQKQRVDAI